MSFEWQTEEEEWVERSLAAEGHRPLRARLPLLLLVVVMALVVGLLWWQVGKQAALAEDQVRQEVLATDRLLHDAVQQQDWELVKSMLSGRDPRWAAGQRRLLAAGLLFEGPPLLLGIQPASTRSGQSEVSISIDLATVTVTVPYDYLAGTAGERLAFHQTHVYRRGADRWLLVPPGRAFWGDTRPVVAGRYVTALVSERDRPLVIRMLADFERHWDRLCAASLARACTQSIPLELHFSSEPDTLFLLAEPPSPPEEHVLLELPTPSLFGRPANEAAYQALYRSYARVLLSTALGRELALASNCCRRTHFYQAAIDWLLSQEGLQEWPLASEQYRQALLALEGPGQLHVLWETEQPEEVGERERWLIYSLVELLLAELRATPDVPVLLETMHQYDNVAPWVRAVSGSLSIAALYPVWREALVERMQTGEMAAALAPSQDLVLACGDGGANYIYLYQTAQAGWIQLFAPERGFVTFYPFADDQALLLSGSQPAAGLGQTVLWETAGETRLARAPINSIHVVDSPHASPLIWTGTRVDSFFIPAAPVNDPLEQFATAWYFEREESLGQLSLVDLQSCQQSSGCRHQAVSGRLIWSPDGQRLLLVSGRGVLLYRERTETAWTPLAAGRSPFWINNTTFFYLAVDGQQIRFGQTGTAGRDQEWLAIDALFAGIEPVGNPRVINEVIAGPTALAVLATDRRQRMSYLFLLPRPVAGTQPPDSLEAPFEGKVLLQEIGLTAAETLLSFSPDGRWLVVYGPATEGGQTSFWIYDVVHRQLLLAGEMAGEAGRGSLFDWSADGSWLAHWWGKGLLELVAPGPVPSRHYLAPPAHSPQGIICRSLAWIDRELP